MYGALDPRRPAAPRRKREQVKPVSWPKIASRTAAAAIIVACGFQAMALLADRQPGASSQEGFRIAILSAEKYERAGVHTVRVTGRITNNSSAPLPVSEVSVAATDADGRPAHLWTHRPAIRWIGPGQSFRFSTANGSLPLPARRIEIRFAGVVGETEL